MNFPQINLIDRHADLKNDWIEEAIYFVDNCLYLEVEEPEIIERLKENWNVIDDWLFFIFAAGKILHQDNKVSHG